MKLLVEQNYAILIIRLYCIIIFHMLTGKATGLVTTARVTHATPAALYAHTPHRYWEYNRNVPKEAQAEGCKDIAVQLIENGKDINVSCFIKLVLIHELNQGKA